MSEDLQFPKADFKAPPLVTLRVANANNKPAFVILLDPQFNKPGVVIDIPEMDDPTIGHPRSYQAFMQDLKGDIVEPGVGMEGPIISSPSSPVGGLYLWSPNLAANLDLYTMHCFEAGQEEEQFDRLRIIRPRFPTDQQRNDVLVWTHLHGHERFGLSRLTRISMILPAFTQMILELYPVAPYPLNL